MKVEYDIVADVIYFRFSGNNVDESEEIAEGIIIDYDPEGAICGIEILDFSKRDLDLNRLVRLRDEEVVAEVAAV